MEDMAGEEGLGEDEGGLEGGEGADFEVDLEGEEHMVGDGEADRVIFWEDGLIVFMARKAWRWRQGKKGFVLCSGNQAPAPCLLITYIYVHSLPPSKLLRNPPPTPF